MGFNTAHKFISCICQSLALSVESNVLFAMVNDCAC